MPPRPVMLVRYLRRLAAPADHAPESDAALLARFSRGRDEAAFAALVERHGSMVLSVCRHVLRDAHGAEDFAQAAFLVLARKAASLRRPQALAAWLHGVALRVARRARADARRRRAEALAAAREPADPRPDPLDALTARELLALLDEEIARLPEAYRLPVLLCLREGRTQQEAARLMGWTAGSVRGRLERGRRKLRARLARRGLTLAAAVGAAEAARGVAAAAVPAALAAATARAATLVAAGQAPAAAASAKAAALAEGVMKTMLLKKLQAVTAVLLAVVLAGAGAACALPSTSGKQGATPMNQNPTAAPPAEKAPETPPDPDEKAIRDYIAELRATVKNPSDDHAVYREVIQPTFRKAAHWAVRRGDDALVVELLRDYYGPNNPDKGGTALTWAAWINDPDLAQILLDRGADVNAAEADGRTALHEAIGWSKEFTKLLLDRGADVNVRTKSGETPLMFAAAGNQPEGCQPEVVRLLLEKKADVNARDDAGRTPLMYAAENGRLENAKLLLSEGADVRRKDKQGRTALDLVKPADNFLKWTGAWTEEGLKKTQARAEQDAEALRRLLERAGGKD